MPPLSVLKQGIRGSNSTIVRGNDQNESCKTGGACRTYQFTLGTSLAVLSPIEQSEKKRLPSFRVQREKRNVYDLIFGFYRD